MPEQCISLDLGKQFADRHSFRFLIQPQEHSALDPLPEVKRRKISRETLDIYAPLAHRLGIGQLKWELEDLAFRNLEPEAYEDVVKRIARKRHDRETLVSDLREILARELDSVGIPAEITGRPKHI